MQHRPLPRRVLVTLVLSLAGCGVGPPDLVLGTADRPAHLAVPTLHDGTTPLPLLVLLHGYGVGAEVQNEYFGLDDVTRPRGVYLLLPESGRDATGVPFWNATDACCNFYGSSVDDVAALDAVIDEAMDAVPIDATRIYLLGHSNGGFMAYRMACERSSRFAGVAILAGMDYLDPLACVPAEPVSILHMHGDGDLTINPAGGALPGAAPYPSARASVDRWAGYADCAAAPIVGAERDLTLERIDHTDRLETAVLDYVGCEPGLGVSLWTLRGEGHAPFFHRDAFASVLGWLLEHRR